MKVIAHVGFRIDFASAFSISEMLFFSIVMMRVLHVTTEKK